MGKIEIITASMLPPEFRSNEVKLRASILRLIIYSALSMLSASVGAEGLTFIVNAENPITTVTTKDLKDYFFKRRQQWPDGSSIRFIDREDSPERKTFLSDFLRQTTEEIDLFWIGQKLYSGNSAPMQAPSQTMVIHFVGTFKGAIGYVSSTAVLTDKKIKTIKVSE